MGRTNYEIRNVGKPDKKAVCKGWEKKNTFFLLVIMKYFSFHESVAQSKNFATSLPSEVPMSLPICKDDINDKYLN